MINRISVFIDKHLQIIRFSVGLLGIAGVGIFLHRTNVFKLYRRISDIPKEVIHKQVLLHGCVKDISEDGIIKVAHQSLILKDLFYVKDDEYLNLQLAGVKPVSGWSDYMNTSNFRKSIQFSLLNKEQVSDAIIYYKKNMFSTRQCINEEVIRNGIAVTVAASPDLLYSSVFNDLIHRLIKIEIKADKLGTKGVWKRESWFKKWIKWK